MILHKELENFKALISLTAKDMGILEFYIEKDYWVTYILKKLSNSSFKNNVVFKGGTSLSKGYNAICVLQVIFPINCNIIFQLLSHCKF